MFATIWWILKKFGIDEGKNLKQLYLQIITCESIMDILKIKFGPLEPLI